MSAAKTFAFGGVIWALLGGAGRVEAADSRWGGGWMYFSGGTGASLGTDYSGALRAKGLSDGSRDPVTSSVFASDPKPTPTPPPPPAPAVSVQTQSTPAFAPVTPAPAPASSARQTADALINLGDSNYPGLADLVTGNPQPWYTSPTVTRFFNGSAPTPDQRADFTNKVLNTVQHTFALSGLHPLLTTDPNQPANHTLSVVSNASFGPNDNAIGITDVGHDGFGFIDKLTYADSVDQLATAVGKNVSHELMHAFGVGKHADTTGHYVDAGTASWAMLTDPESSFSAAAADAIRATNFSPNARDSFGLGGQTVEGEQEIAAVPEPATVAVWALGLVGAVAYRARSKSVRSRLAA